MLAVARAFQYLGLPSDTKKIVSPLLRLLRMSPEIERVTLAYILSVARSSPVRQHLVHYAIDTNLTCEKTLFATHWNSFLVRTDDTQKVKKDKMQLLRLVLSPENYQALLREFTVGEV